MNGSERKRKRNLLIHRQPALNTIFAPESIALIGAAEAPGSVGRVLLENLKSYHGPVYPVNLRRHSVLGLPAFPKIGAIPSRVDLAIIEPTDATRGTVRRFFAP
jgi:acetyltransferase